MSRDHVDLVTEFCNSLLAADMAKTVRYLSDDIVYHNLPWEPVRGHDAVRKALDPFVHGANCAITKMEIHHTTATGDVVMNARSETWERGDARVVLPVAGVFVLRDGLIAEWSDYWDLATFQPFLDAL